MCYYYYEVDQFDNLVTFGCILFLILQLETVFSDRSVTGLKYLDNGKIQII